MSAHLPAWRRHPAPAATDTVLSLPPVLDVIRFEIPVAPRPKLRARATSFGGHARMFDDPKSREDERTVASIAAQYAPAVPHDGPIMLGLEFHVEIPEGYKGWKREAALAGWLLPTGRPDLDNLEKLFFDALSRSKRWWLNDSRVVGYVNAPRKVFSETPKTVAEVHFLQAIGAAEWKAEKARRAMQARPREAGLWR